MIDDSLVIMLHKNNIHVRQSSCGFWNPGIIIVQGPGNLLEFSHFKEEVMETFWKSNVFV